MSKRSLGILASVVAICVISFVLPRAASPQQITAGAFITSPMTVRVTADQPMTASTLTAIPGLSWTLPSLSAAQAYSFHCAGSYNQATAGSDEFGLQVTPAVNNWEATGTLQTALTGFRAGVAQTQTTTSPKAVVNGTPTAGSDLTWKMEGTVENKASQSVTVSIMYLAGGGNSTTIYTRFVLPRTNHSIGQKAGL